MKMILTTALVLMSTAAFASATRVVSADQLQSSDALKVYTLPASTTSLIGNNTTDTLTNKTLTSPAITTPTGIVKGDVGLANVDNTSDATKNAATVTLTNKSISGATNTLTAIPAATALSGSVPVANGGTGSSTLTSSALVVGAGTSAVTFISPGANGQVLTSNGTVWSSAAAPSTAPSVTGTSAAPTSVTAAGGIVFSGTAYENYAFIAGSAGAVTITATPQITAGTSVGQRLVLIGRSATNTVSIADGNGLSLNGPATLGLDSLITLVWSGVTWTEASRR